MAKMNGMGFMACGLILALTLQGTSATFRLLQEPIAASPEAAAAAAPETLPQSIAQGEPFSDSPPADNGVAAAPGDAGALPSPPAAPEEAATPEPAIPFAIAAAPEFAQSPIFGYGANAEAPGPAGRDPRDAPCDLADRTPREDFFTCPDFNGVYCLYSEAGATGNSTCSPDGGYRCESLNAEPTVYGALAYYESLDDLYEYCTQSSQCADGQFCDRSALTEFESDVPFGRCVAYLDQACL